MLLLVVLTKLCYLGLKLGVAALCGRELGFL